MKRFKLFVCTIGMAFVSSGFALAQDPSRVDWKVVPAHQVMLFWPAQSSYQWLRGRGHIAAKMVKAGIACQRCHEGQEEQLGNNLVRKNRLEPSPIEGKSGVIKLSVQVAYDDKHAYFRAHWQTQNPYPGEAHPFVRYNGKIWEQFGFPKLDEVVQKGKQPGIYEDRFSMIIDDGSVPNFANHGCWVACHKGQRDMPEVPSESKVKANPMFKEINKKDVRKYLPDTRTDAMASWNKAKSMDEINKLKVSGAFLDLMQWRAHRSNPVGMADDFYVLEYRNSDAGKSPFSSNVNKEMQQPKYMYNEKLVGKKALREEDIRQGNTALIREKNAVPFDPGAGWQVGDLIPAYITSRVDAKDSAADNQQVKGEWQEGAWTVVWARALNLVNSDDKSLSEGKVYNFSFAVHDDNITTRGHHVSFPVTVGFGVKADIEAVRLQ